MLKHIDQLEDTFIAAYGASTDPIRTPVPKGFLFGSRGAEDLFGLYSGATFGSGLYRLVSVKEADVWNALVLAAFPQFAGRIACFGYDWLGRFFAVDKSRLVNEQPGVVLLEPGTGEALEIPCEFLAFHTDELTNHAEAALARSAFEAWNAEQDRPLSENECAGYRVPLFLGGRDEVANMARTDLKVYWDICAQMLSQTREMREGERISRVSLR